MRKTHKPPDLGFPPLPIPPEEPEIIPDYIFAIHLYLSEEDSYGTAHHQLGKDPHPPLSPLPG